MLESNPSAQVGAKARRVAHGLYGYPWPLFLLIICFGFNALNSFHLPTIDPTGGTYVTIFRVLALGPRSPGWRPPHAMAGAMA
jgi:hypothetical protein